MANPQDVNTIANQLGQLVTLMTTQNTQRVTARTEQQTREQEREVRQAQQNILKCMPFYDNSIESLLSNVMHPIAVPK